jgi:hypothetical protein
MCICAHVMQHLHASIHNTSRRSIPAVMYVCMYTCMYIYIPTYIRVHATNIHVMRNEIVCICLDPCACICIYGFIHESCTRRKRLSHIECLVASMLHALTSSFYFKEYFSINAPVCVCMHIKQACPYTSAKKST